MRMIRSVLLGVSAFVVVALGLSHAAFGATGADTLEMVGAKVYGPSHLPVGNVVAVLKSENDGSPLMYVVNANGIFNGRGVIPLANVTQETPRPKKNGEIEYDVTVTVNRSTFKNIANWGRGELLSDYLSRHEGLLSTIYKIDASELERMARVAVYDDGKAAKARESELASASL